MGGSRESSIGGREKIAVLGGGPAGLAAAFELTATPALRRRFEVTVYQRGWRLGGKCASGRNASRSQRLEEHGLHLWFGFYDNAFRMMRATYDALARPASDRLATFEDAFEACDGLVLWDRQGTGWHPISFVWPRNEERPGADYPLPDVWEIAFRVFEWAASTWDALAGEALGGGEGGSGVLDLARGALLSVGVEVERGGEQLLHLAHQLTRAGHLAARAPQPRLPGAGWATALARRSALAVVARLSSAFRDWMWRRFSTVFEQSPDARMFFTMFDTFASALAGVVADGVLERGWDAINDRELCDWLAEHGAHEVTLGATPAERSPLLRAVYDVAFAYPGGVIGEANAAAGTALNDLLRMAFTYRGSLFYRMGAGLGEAVFTPLYELLKEREVRFEFFNAVSDLGLSDDGQRIERVRVVQQAKLSGDNYEPLVEIDGLMCWPSEPRWSELRDGEALSSARADFEREVNPSGRRPRDLRLGRDFDSVVLAIPVGALPEICGELARRDESFRRMLRSASTVATQAVQLWTARSSRQLGWANSERSIAGSFDEPLSTACDMTHLVAGEGWAGSEEPLGLAYLCGVLEEPAEESPGQALGRVAAGARAFAESDLTTLWPGAAAAGGTFDWDVLAAAQGTGPARMAAQYCRANTGGSERYVLSLAGSMGDRLSADGTRVENLVLAGDWTRNGIDAGCVEAAVLSGMQAARVLIGHKRRFRGESHRWLTDRREHRV